MTKKLSGKIKIAENMKKIYLLLAVACLAAIGCTKEISDNTMPEGSVVLKAKVESDTKVGAIVDKENKTVAFTWTKGDQIAVQTTSGVANFTLVGEGGEANAKFTGDETPINGGFSIFPAAAASQVAGKIVLPSEYNYVEGQTNALLYATVVNDEVRFTHLGGLISVEINGVPAGAKFVLTAAGQKINGEYTIDASAEVPVLNVAEAASADESSVAVKFENATENAVVYIPLPAGDYTSMKAQIFNAENKLISEAIATSTKSIKRKGMKAMPNMILMLNDWFVTVAGAGSKDGSSWDNAMGVAELRALLAQPVDAEGNQINEEAHQKANLLDGATINFAAGDYYLAGEAKKLVKMEFSHFEKQVAVNFLGGYPAGLTGMSKAGRDAAANATAFTGNDEALIWSFGNQTDISFDGFTFKNAKLDVDGGAIYASSGESGECTLTLTNCKFQNNTNTSSKTGAGMYIVNATVNAKNCEFSGNYARNGSAINMKAGKGTVTVENSVFKSNSTANTSGAVQNGGKTAEFKNCTFEKNEAGSWGGGAFHTGGEGANTTFTDCAFNENKAIQGGAISIEAATCTFTRCSFTKNQATNGDRTNGESDSSKKLKAGGAFIIRNAKAICNLNACTFTENQATNGCGGAIVSTDQGSLLTINAGTSFNNNWAYFDGGAIGIDGRLIINGTSDSRVVFSGNKTLTTKSGTANGGAISLWASGSGDTKKSVLNHVLFTGNEAGQESGSTVNYSNGGGLYMSGTAYVEASNLEFTDNRGRNGGGLSYNSSQNSTFDNCNFHTNVCRSGPNKDNKGGAAGNFNGAATQHGGTGHVAFNGCTFKNNIVQGCSAVLHLNGTGSSTMTDCWIEGNQSYTNQGILIRTEKAGARLYLNRCMFKGNFGPNRGLIRLAENSLGYMNDVTFRDNYTNDGGNSWGVNIHAAFAHICMNNVTSYNNYNKNGVDGNSIIAFNSDGGWIVVNSTIIDKVPGGLLRANYTKINNVATTRKMSICNNILLNEFAADKMFVFYNNDQLVDKGHNLMSCSANPTNGASTNLLSQKASTLSGSYSENWTGTHPYGVYLWSNALTGFTPATGNEVYEAIAAYTETDTNVVASGTIGADFYNWLKSIGAVTESGDQKIFKDGRGVTRTGNYWPGAYQAN